MPAARVNMRGNMDDDVGQALLEKVDDLIRRVDAVLVENRQSRDRQVDDVARVIEECRALQETLRKVREHLEILLVGLTPSPGPGEPGFDPAREYVK